MSEPTVEQLMSMEKNPVNKPSVVGPIIAFFLFPPIGLYLLWKEKTFHAVFAVLTALLGILNLLSAVSLFFIGSGANIILIITTISLLQIAGCYYFYQKAKSRGYLEVSELIVLATTVLLVDFIIVPVLFGTLFFQAIKPYLDQNIDQLNQYKNFPAN